MMSVFLLGLLLILPYQSLAQIRVGNGGEAICKQLSSNSLCATGHLVLRDLFEVEVEPRFGEQADSYFRAQVQALDLDQLKVSRDLLARKLTDLQTIQPHLGALVLRVLESLDWSLVSDRLYPTPDEVVRDSPYQRVQIGNRFQGRVFVSIEAFELLDEANKVAFLIHEAIYSLIPPLTLNDGTSVQKAYKAREIVGQLFNMADGHFDLSADIRSHIGILSKDRRPQGPSSAYSYTNRSVHLTLQNSYEDRVIDRNSTSINPSPVEIEDITKKICRKIDPRKQQTDPLDIVVETFRDPFILERRRYRVRASDGSIVDQFWYYTDYRQRAIRQDYRPINREECESHVRDFLSIADRA